MVVKAHKKRVVWSLLLVVLLAAVIRALVVELPSDQITIYSGPVGGTFYNMALTYREALQADGYSVTIKPSESTAQLLERVNGSDAPNSIGFLMGSYDHSSYPRLQSLGFVDQQPLFLFYSAAYGEMVSLATLKGRRIVLPPKDSITAQTALNLLSQYNINQQNTDIEFLPFQQAISVLQAGDAYGMFLMLGAEHPAINRLMSDPNLRAFSYRNTSGLLKKLNDLDEVMIAPASYDVLRQIPAKALNLLAARVEIIANDRLDSAAAYALLNVFENLHHRATLTNAVDAFPIFSGLLAPPNPITQNFAKTGTPWLYRTLPGELAVLIDKYLIIGLAIFLLAEAYRVMRYLYEFLALSAETLSLNILRRQRNLRAKGKQPGMVGRLLERWAQAVVTRQSIRQKAADTMTDSP
jgi:TRAP-type uncharacterized transport system substrate-binding protein